MSDLKTQINDEIKTAMKAKNKTRLNVFRYLKKLFIENDTSTNKKLSELDIIINYAKKVRDSLELYPKDSDQRKEIQEEVTILEEYLPKQLSEEDVKVLIDDIIAKQGTTQMGMVMKDLSPRIKGKFDGKRASDLVKTALDKK